MAAERAINLALRVMGIGEAERDLKRVGKAGEQAFEQVERSANGADRAVSEYTARLRRAVSRAKEAFDATPGIDVARVADPAGYLQARNKAILDSVEVVKQQIKAGIPEAGQAFEQLGGAVDGAGMSVSRFASLAAAGGIALYGLGRFVWDSIEAFAEHEKALDAFEGQLAFAGNQSSATAEEIAAMAAQIRDSSLQTEEGALRAALALAQVPGMTREGMRAALEATAAFADKIGTELPDEIEGKTRPVLMALANRDMKALLEATKDMDRATANAIVRLAAAGEQAEATKVLLDHLTESAGDGANGLATATDKATDSWTRFKLALGEEFTDEAAGGLNLIGRLLDSLREKSERTGVSLLRVLSPTLLGPLFGGNRGKAGEPLHALPSDVSSGFLGRMMGAAERAAQNSAEAAERRRLEKLYGDTAKPKSAPRAGGRSGKSDAEREAERLKREAEQAREAADRVIESNADVVQSYRDRVAEAEAKIGLEGDALRAVERHYEVEAAVRRINTEMIDREVEARRAAAAAAGEQFDAVLATAEATDVVEAQQEAVRRLAERFADAADATAAFNRRQAEAKAILQQLETPLERVNREVEKALELLHNKNLTPDQFDRYMDDLAKDLADITYEANESAQAWRGFGQDVGRSLADIALNGGDALDILQELVRLPLERMLQQHFVNPVADWIDAQTGNNRDKNLAAARASLPGAISTSVQVLDPAAQGAAISLEQVQLQGTGAAQALAAVAATGNPIVDLTGETERATRAMAGLDPQLAQFGGSLANVIASIAGAGGGGGGGGLAGILQMGLSLAGAAMGGGGLGATAARLAPSVMANIDANPAIFSSGSPGLPIGKPVWVGENGRELVEALPGGRLKVHSNQDVRRFQSRMEGATIINAHISVPQRADPRRTISTVSRGLQQGMSRSARKGIASPAGSY